MEKRQKPEGRAVTLKDVADRAGVSTMTVSNVLNRVGRASASTRTHVLRAVEALGYVPNIAAKRLAGTAPSRLGLICFSTEGLFVSRVVTGAASAATARGLQLLIRDGAEYSRDGAVGALERLLRDGADLLLLVPPFAEMLAESDLLRDSGLPVAAVATGGPLPGVTTVRIDNGAATRALCELLIGQGHRRIGLVTGRVSHGDSIARLEGYRAGLLARGLAPDDALVVDGDFSFEAGLSAAGTLLAFAERPTAIIAGNDEMAAGVLWAAHRDGLRVPEDLSVTGFDDSAIATRVWPALTVIRQPIAEMAAHATHLLADMTRRTAAPRGGQDILLDWTLVERGSTGAPASKQVH